MKQKDKRNISFRTLMQRLSLWILIKTKYQFKIEYDSFNIEVHPVGVTTPTRYDFVCTNKHIGFMNYIEMTRHFYLTEIFDCPNPLTKGIKFNDEEKVKNLERQYNNLIKLVKQSGRVVLRNSI